ncbi:hypothetical protein C8R44DRAFT_881762 [Mycena epipterygia]|nr:hypothetical protein C8R44DRAFT_881762 [Mycena epipterygia]
MSLSNSPSTTDDGSSFPSDLLSTCVFPKEIQKEILSHCRRSDLPVFALASYNSACLVREQLYREIGISFRRAQLLFRTLAEDEEGGIARKIRLLDLMEGRPSEIHPGPHFLRALQLMASLRYFFVRCRVEPALLLSFVGELRVFTYAFPICDTLYRFLTCQPTIRSLSLKSTFNNYALFSTFLPKLRHLEALPHEIPRLINGRPIRHLRMCYLPDDALRKPSLPLNNVLLSTCGLRVLEMMGYQFLDDPDAPRYFPELEELILLQDATWGKRNASPRFPGLMNTLAERLTGIEQLDTVIFVTTLSKRAAVTICGAFRAHCRAPRLQELVVHTFDRCISWDDFRDIQSRPVQMNLSACDQHHIPQ